ncbi:hypothetical protein OpiT1DRAFT_04355 [Opitutaceae bacterium TAV1]|nr:hypothetical protein OpiT1DRAFT_04355 [Opitutaceae bacterium TAV1]
MAMELNLQPLAPVCFVSGRAFAEGERVASFLVRPETPPEPGAPEVVRYDVLESELGGFTAPGPVACRWVQLFKPRKQNENPERELKLTAESLFLTLADPATLGEADEETVRMVQVLALMLERKRVLRPKGSAAGGARSIYEHAKSKQLYEIPAVTDLNPEFFLSIQEQLAALVGGGRGGSDGSGAGVPPADGGAA